MVCIAEDVIVNSVDKIFAVSGAVPAEILVVGGENKLSPSVVNVNVEFGNLAFVIVRKGKIVVEPVCLARGDGSGQVHVGQAVGDLELGGAFADFIAGRHRIKSAGRHINGRTDFAGVPDVTVKIPLHRQGGLFRGAKIRVGVV